MATSIPMIIRFLGTSDAGEFGAAECPHCGAKGRYTAHFVLADGSHGAAMAGCLKLFPCSPVAREEARLQKKQADYAKKGWKLNRGDTEALAALERFYAGIIDERAALAIVRSAKSTNQMRYARVR